MSTSLNPLLNHPEQIRVDNALAKGDQNSTKGMNYTQITFSRAFCLEQSLLQEKNELFEKVRKFVVVVVDSIYEHNHTI